MEALTLHQPWATAIAEGIKTIETRSWSTSYRGPLAIHAGKRMPASWTTIGPYRIKGFGRTGLALVGPGLPEFRSTPRLEGCLVPLGAVVATATLVDVVPIGGPTSFSTGIFEGETPPTAGMDVIVHHEALGDWAPERLVLDRWNGPTEDVSHELPWGDFTPGRFAYLLTDVRKLDVPIPARGRQGLWEWVH
jgi:hypothetical protein